MRKPLFALLALLPSLPALAADPMVITNRSTKPWRLVSNDPGADLKVTYQDAGGRAVSRVFPHAYSNLLPRYSYPVFDKWFEDKARAAVYRHWFCVDITVRPGTSATFEIIGAYEPLSFAMIPFSLVDHRDQMGAVTGVVTYRVRRSRIPVTREDGWPGAFAGWEYYTPSDYRHVLEVDPGDRTQATLVLDDWDSAATGRHDNWSISYEGIREEQWNKDAIEAGMDPARGFREWELAKAEARKSGEPGKAETKVETKAETKVETKAETKVETKVERKAS